MDKLDKLNQLNQQVTDAILRSERLPTGTQESRDAFAEVSRLEQAIAHVTSAFDLEGTLARWGAVNAAVCAEDWERVFYLATCYLRRRVPKRLRRDLLEFKTLAKKKLEKP